MNTIEKFDNYVMNTYGRFGVALEKGNERSCVDENGKEYIDFGSGIGTNSLGFCDSRWADAVCAQVRSIQHTSNYYYAGEFLSRENSVHSRRYGTGDFSQLLFPISGGLYLCHGKRYDRS